MVSFAVDSEAEWLALRESNVGGSEVAALFYRWRMPDGRDVVRHLYQPAPEQGTPLGSVSPYKTPMRLWAEKSGKVMPADISNERTRAGRHMEAAIAAWSREKWGWNIRKVRRYLAHDAAPGWGASLDYELHESGSAGAPVEFKNVDFLVFRDEWEAEEETVLAPPLHITLQVQAQIGCANADHGWIVPCVGGNEILRGRIDRHEPVQRMIAEAVAAFWGGVRSGQPPSHVADIAAVADCHAFALDESAGALDLSADSEFTELCRRYLRWQEHQVRTEIMVDNLKGRIALKLGEHTRAKGQLHNVTWTLVNRPERIVPERLQPAMSFRGALYVRVPTEPRKRKAPETATAALKGKPAF